MKAEDWVRVNWPDTKNRAGHWNHHYLGQGPDSCYHESRGDINKVFRQYPAMDGGHFEAVGEIPEDLERVMLRPLEISNEHGYCEQWDAIDLIVKREEALRIRELYARVEKAILEFQEATGL